MLYRQSGRVNEIMHGHFALAVKLYAATRGSGMGAPSLSASSIHASIASTPFVTASL
jgi:hypothetical protein